MKPALEPGISNLTDASFKAFRLYQPAFEPHWHYHPEVELVLFLRGKGMRFIGEDVALYEEGEVYLLGKNLPHTFVTYADAATPLVEALCIQFPATLFGPFRECRAVQALVQEANRGLVFPAVPPALVQDIQRVLNSHGVEALAALLHTLNRLAQTARQPVIRQPHQPTSLPLENPTRIQHAVDFIQATYQRPVTLAEIADHCHLSPNAFCRWFKAQLGLTFVAYLHSVRLAHVCQRLLSTDEAIGHIALQTGFEHSSTLNRLFRQKMGTSPGQYRRNRPGPTTG